MSWHGGVYPAIVVYVYDASNKKPIPNATVTITDAKGYVIGIQGTTAPNGFVTFTNVPYVIGDTYYITASANGYNSNTVSYSSSNLVEIGRVSIGLTPAPQQQQTTTPPSGGNVQATSGPSIYEQVKNNPYVLSYALGVLGGGSNCHSVPAYASNCIPNDIFTIGDTASIMLLINIPYNAPLPTVSFYMKVENTGQVILIDILTPQTGFYDPSRVYVYREGYQVNPDGTVTRNPLVSLVSTATHFTLELVMKDVNGNPAYVYGSVSIYATITTPGGTITTMPVTLKLNFPTRIVNLKVSPNPAGPGQKITVSGQLQRLTPSGQWVGLPGQEVDIDRLVSYLYSGWYLFEEASAVTDSNGNFSATVTAPSTPGTHTLYVRYPGNDNESLTGTYTTISFMVVGSQTTSKPTTVKPKLSAGDLAIVGGGLAVIVGTVAYDVLKRKK